MYFRFIRAHTDIPKIARWVPAFKSMSYDESLIFRKWTRRDFSVHTFVIPMNQFFLWKSGYHKLFTDEYEWMTRLIDTKTNNSLNIIVLKASSHACMIHTLFSSLWFRPKINKRSIKPFEMDLRNLFSASAWDDNCQLSIIIIRYHTRKNGMLT